MTNKNTIPSAFLQRVEQSGNRQALLERQDSSWVSYGWNEWAARSRAIAAALIRQGVKPADHVAIYSYTRREWVEADIGILMTGARTVTVYHNVNTETVMYILDDCGAAVVFAEGPIQLKTLFDPKTGALPAKVQRVVYFVDRQTPLPRQGEPTPDDVYLDQVVPANARDRLCSIEQLIAEGDEALKDKAVAAEVDARIHGILPDDVARIIYTSGTTGTPKGAMLTHYSFIFVVQSIQEALNLRAEQVVLLFLPLAHVYAHLSYQGAISFGYTLAFARSMLTAVEDASEVRPHFFTTVPRLYEKIHAGVLTQVESGSRLKRRVFGWATKIGGRVSKAKQRDTKVSRVLRSKLKVADRLVFSKLKKRLGGRIEFMVSGGAPLSRSLAEFFHAADLQIFEGYGMTENASLSHYNQRRAYKFGTVGKPIPGIEVKIADDGEILVRGPNVMKGYLNKPEDTAEAIDTEGWLHTGDVGVIDSQGYLTITDRKKEIIVTSGGKNVPPAPIERYLSESRFVSQAIVFGDRRKYLVALLTLDVDYVRWWAKDNGIADDDVDRLALSESLRAAVQADIAEVNKKMDPYSTVKKFALLPRDFTIQDGEMTPSLKLRRKVIEQRHHEVLAKLYPPEAEA